MFKRVISGSSRIVSLSIIGTIALAMMLTAGCGSRQAAQMPAGAEVKAITVIQRDTPVTYEFIGQVVAKDEAQIRSKVAGNIVTKMIAGGSTVQAGQPLFQIDRRQYEAAVLNANASLAQAEAVLSQANRDLARYEQLAGQGAVAQQVLDNANYLVQQDAALVEVNRAKRQQAEADLADTLIVAPFSGRIDVNELSLGGFAQAGSTTLATISSVDPVFVQFSLSENEYLHFSGLGRGNSPAEWFGNLTLVLGDGTQYPLLGTVDQVDRGLAQNTGTLTIKALFANPQQVLVPGMFARVIATGEMRSGALLVPQRAVQQLLGKYFITVVGADNKAESRPVTMGPKIGDLWIVDSGLTAGDVVVVDGAQKAQPGTPLQVTMIQSEEPQAPAQN